MQRYKDLKGEAVKASELNLEKYVEEGK